MTIRVIVVDDHVVVREGLRAVLGAEPDIHVEDECGDGAEAVRLAAKLRPDVVLMDLRLPELDGVAATAQITAEASAAVLVLTSYDTDGDVTRAVAAGAAGYLLKDASRSELVAAVRSAARGETAMGGAVAARLADQVRRGQRCELTAREREILERVARGMSNPQIGRELYIAEATVKSHVTRIFAKLGVDDRTAAVTVAIARGVIPPPTAGG